MISRPFFFSPFFRHWPGKNRPQPKIVGVGGLVTRGNGSKKRRGYSIARRLATVIISPVCLLPWLLPFNRLRGQWGLSLFLLPLFSIFKWPIGWRWVSLLFLLKLRLCGLAKPHCRKSEISFRGRPGARCIFTA